jgi:hypothetical protein
MSFLEATELDEIGAEGPLAVGNVLSDRQPLVAQSILEKLTHLRNGGIVFNGKVMELALR